MKHSSELTHILYDLGRIAVFAALLYGGILAMVKFATRPKKPGDRELQNERDLNRQQRRQRRAMNKRKRRR